MKIEKVHIIIDFMKFRMYVDETGNPDLGSSDNPLHRYLCLTGIILDLEIAKNELAPKLDIIKNNYFSIEYDEPIILHRKELINKRPPFDALRNPEVEANFNKDLLSLLSNLDFVAVTVVIDKQEHRSKYKVWTADPYHYCLKILTERFVLFLEDKTSVGDILSESRGGKEDNRLKASYTRLYQSGTEYIASDRFQAVLTSKELKVKPKNANIAALQLADIIAHPSRQEILAQAGRIEYDPGKFGNEIIKILIQSKYYRNSNGKIRGYGTKLLP